MKNVKLNRVMADALRQAINVVLEDTDVSIYTKELMRNEGDAVKFNVSWKSIGDVDVESAMKMARDIEKAAKVAEFLNDMKIDFTYERDAKVDEMVAQGKFKDARNYVKGFSDVFRVAMETKESIVLDTFRA